MSATGVWVGIGRRKGKGKGSGQEATCGQAVKVKAFAIYVNFNKLITAHISLPLLDLAYSTARSLLAILCLAEYRTGAGWISGVSGGAACLLFPRIRTSARSLLKTRSKN